MISAINSIKNNNKNQAPSFGSKSQIVYSKKAERALSKLRISMDTEARNYLRGHMNFVDTFSRTAAKDGENGKVKLYIGSLNGIQGSREELKVTNPLIKGKLTKITPEGKIVTSHRFNADMQTTSEVNYTKEVDAHRAHISLYGGSSERLLDALSEDLPIALQKILNDNRPDKVIYTVSELNLQGKTPVIKGYLSVIKGGSTTPVKCEEPIAIKFIPNKNKDLAPHGFTFDLSRFATKADELQN